VVFSDPWEPLSSTQGAAQLERELQAELSPTHPLYGISTRAIARSLCADDVLFEMENGRVAEVHLTWRGAPERAPWPSHKTYEGIGDWLAAQARLPS
jgi:hypothetical protein